MITAFGAFLPMFAQLSPAITSWRLNRTGATGFNNLPADVQRVQFSPTAVYVTASGIPSYSIGPWARNPNTAGNQNKTYKIPLAPQVQSGTKTATGLGRIAVFTNGVAIYNAKDAFSYQNANVWFQNAVVVEAPSFDACQGHPDMSSTYHNHQAPKCGYTFSPTQHSPIVGYSFDGYPIYGPYAFANSNGTGDIKRMVSSYRLRNITTRRTLPNGTTLQPNQYGPDISTQYPLGYYLEDYEFVRGLGDLDEYNGRFAITPEYPQGTYAYYTTLDASGNSAYPYVIGPNYYGVVERSNTGMGQVNITETTTEFLGTVTTNPIFTASPNNIPFGTVAVGQSSIRSFIVQGSQFTTSLVVTAPAGFSISTNQNGSYSQTLTIPISNGNLPNTTVFVRFSPTQAGTFMGTITQTTGTVSLTPITLSATAQVQSSVRAGFSTNFSIFPNPTSEAITLEVTPENIGEMRFTLLDVLGNRLFTNILPSTSIGAPLKYSLPVSDLASGSYFVEFVQGSTRLVKPFVKY
jgi:hypothetical protein